MLPHSMLRINRKQNLFYIVNDKCLSPYPQEKMNRRVGCSPALASSAEVFIIEESVQLHSKEKKTLLSAPALHVVRKGTVAFQSLTCWTAIHHLHSSP